MSIDVNPSISITIENDVVVDVSAYNDDGQRLMLGGDVIGMEKQQVLSAIITALVAGGYIQSEGGSISHYHSHRR